MEYTEFLNWLKDNGAVFPNIDFPSFEGPFNLRGVSANNLIPQYTVIRTV